MDGIPKFKYLIVVGTTEVRGTITNVSIGNDYSNYWFYQKTIVILDPVSPWFPLESIIGTNGTNETLRQKWKSSTVGFHILVSIYSMLLVPVEYHWY